MMFWAFALLLAAAGIGAVPSLRDDTTCTTCEFQPLDRSSKIQ